MSTNQKKTNPRLIHNTDKYSYQYQSSPILHVPGHSFKEAKLWERS